VDLCGVFCVWGDFLVCWVGRSRMLDCSVLGWVWWWGGGGGLVWVRVVGVLDFVGGFWLGAFELWVCCVAAVRVLGCCEGGCVWCVVGSCVALCGFGFAFWGFVWVCFVLCGLGGVFGVGGVGVLEWVVVFVLGVGALWVGGWVSWFGGVLVLAWGVVVYLVLGVRVVGGWEGGRGGVCGFFVLFSVVCWFRVSVCVIAVCGVCLCWGGWGCVWDGGCCWFG